MSAIMNKNILTIILLIFFSFATLNANEYKDIVTIKLKKDVHKKILVSSGKNVKLFKFRWTLYATNGGLVVFRSYDRTVGQNILYLRHRNQSFRVELLTRGASNYNVPYLLIKFKEFDFQTNEAIFQLFLSDRNSEVSLEHL